MKRRTLALVLAVAACAWATHTSSAQFLVLGGVLLGYACPDLLDRPIAAWRAAPPPDPARRRRSRFLTGFLIGWWLG